MSTKVIDKRTAENQNNTPKQTEEQTTETTTTPAELAAETEPAEPTIAELQTQLKAVQTEAAKNLDGWQRAMAELANYKKRQAEQVARRQEEITGQIIAELLPILDDLDLAYQNVPESLSEQEQNWIEGFKLVQRKLMKILEMHSVEVISTEGEFDPTLHEAITHEESPDHESNAIIAELRKGYKLGSRVLRPSLVRVAQ